MGAYRVITEHLIYIINIADVFVKHFLQVKCYLIKIAVERLKIPADLIEHNLAFCRIGYVICLHKVSKLWRRAIFSPPERCSMLHALFKKSRISSWLKGFYTVNCSSYYSFTYEDCSVGCLFFSFR